MLWDLTTKGSKHETQISERYKTVPTLAKLMTMGGYQNHVTKDHMEPGYFLAVDSVVLNLVLCYCDA